MSSGGDSDLAANSWPGFVDILSAVVIMFVFFVLVTAAVLYFYTLTYKAKVEGQAAQVVELAAAKAQITEQAIDSTLVAELQSQNELLRKEIESVNEKRNTRSGTSDVESTNETQAAESFGKQSGNQELLTSEEKREFLVFHDPGAITINEDTGDKIYEFIRKMESQYGAENIEIVVNSPKQENAATQTREKRLAVARMLNLRNSLLNTNIDRENIKLKVVESELVEESADWTRFQINVLK